MMIDFSTLDHGDFDTDLCVIGSGPAGLAIAREFLNTSVRVLVVESGGERTSAFSDGLSATESVGAARVADQSEVRSRIFGGSSHIWSGRCAPFDNIDYERRPWLPLSGWPISAVTMGPYLDRASANLGLGPTWYDDQVWARGLSLRWYDRRIGKARSAPQPALSNELVRAVYWQLSKDASNAADYMRCGPWFRQFAADNVQVLLNATVTQLNLSADGARMESVDISAPGRPGRRIRATAFVLGAGGIENPRLLLASRSVQAKGVGNSRDLVGRYFMDHARTAFATIDPRRSWAIRDRYSVHRLNDPNGAHNFVTGFGLSDGLQRREGLLNCSAWLIPESAPDDPWDAVKRWRNGKSGLSRALPALFANAGLMADGAVRLARRMPVRHKLQSLSIFADVEQKPDADSRVTLSDRTDALGVALPRIDWRIGELEKQTIRRLGQVAAAEFDRTGLAKLQLAPWLDQDRDAPVEFKEAAHPSGGTRMAQNPSEGVVDEHCQVHGVGALYMAGSSVFPTNSHANPTLMIVALAIRLADRIKATHFRSASSVSQKGQHAQPAEREVVPQTVGAAAAGQEGTL